MFQEELTTKQKGKKMKLNMKRKNKGFTLIEVLLVVGFIALAGIGVYTIYSKVQISNAANTEARNLDTIRAGVKSLYGASPNYNVPSAINATVLNNARITPENMRASATTIVNSFGGAVTIAPVNLGSGTNNGFRITYNNVPAEVCVKLATTGGAAFDQLTINAGTTPLVKGFGTNVVDPARVAENCNAAPATGVSMLFDSL